MSTARPEPRRRARTISFAGDLGPGGPVGETRLRVGPRGLPELVHEDAAMQRDHRDEQDRDEPGRGGGEDRERRAEGEGAEPEQGVRGAREVAPDRRRRRDQQDDPDDEPVVDRPAREGRERDEDQARWAGRGAEQRRPVHAEQDERGGAGAEHHGRPRRDPAVRRRALLVADPPVGERGGDEHQRGAEVDEQDAREGPHRLEVDERAVVARDADPLDVAGGLGVHGGPEEEQPGHHPVVGGHGAPEEPADDHGERRAASTAST